MTMIRISTAAALWIGTVLAVHAETPADQQQMRKLHEEHYKAEQWLLKKQMQKSQNSKGGAVQQGSASISDINLPGTADNNAALKQALEVASRELKQMNPKKNPAQYESQLASTNQALETIVRCYLTSRSQAKVPQAMDNEDDPFLRNMASIRATLLQKGPDRATLSGLDSTLDEGINMLVNLSETP